MSIKISVIANCQAAPVATLLRFLSPQIEINPIPAVHTIDSGKAQLLFDAVEASEIVLHQPIGEKFGPIATDALRELYPKKIYVSFPSIYFAGALPHLAYLRLPGGGTLKGPLGDYHDLRILKSFLASEDQSKCLNRLDNFQVDVDQNFRRCLDESVRRDALTDIKVMDVVQDRIYDHQTFYTFNHCDNVVLWNVAHRALVKLGIAIEQDAKPPQRKLLGGVIAGIPRSLVEALGFSWSNDSYIINGTEVPNQELVDGFYKVYEDTRNLDVIMQHNKTRFALAVD